jgi:dipeptide transport system ATP-binding protein
VRYIADDVMVMYFGEAVEQGTREAVFASWA